MTDSQRDTETTSGRGEDLPTHDVDGEQLVQEPISGPAKEADASQDAAQAKEEGSNDSGEQTISGADVDRAVKAEQGEDDDIMVIEEAKATNKATKATKSGPAKKIRGPAAVPSKMRDAKSGEAIEWEGEFHGDYTSFKMPMSSAVAAAAHYIDRSYGAPFTAAVMTFLDQNWDDSKPMGRQSWYRKLQASRTPDMVDVEAARVINGGEFPEGISKVIMNSPHGQKWLTDEQKDKANKPAGKKRGKDAVADDPIPKKKKQVRFQDEGKADDEI